MDPCCWPMPPLPGPLAVLPVSAQLCTACGYRPSSSPAPSRFSSLCGPSMVSWHLLKGRRIHLVPESGRRTWLKIVARRLMFDCAKYSLMPPEQFGGVMAASCIDAGLSLTHDIESALRRGQTASLLTVDVKGLFDNINHRQLICTIRDMKFPPPILQWVSSFSFLNAESSPHFSRRHTDQMSRPLILSPTHDLHPLDTARWLGIFFDSKLSFTKHVDILCNRARTAANGPSRVLANTVPGLSQKYLRALRKTCILPIITWAAILWFRQDLPRKGLLNKLERIQNISLRLVCGAFRTTLVTACRSSLTNLPSPKRWVWTKSTAVALMCKSLLIPFA